MCLCASEDIQKDSETNTVKEYKVITGGSDASARSWTFSSGPPAVPKFLSLDFDEKADFPKLVLSVGGQHLVVLSDRGVLYLASSESSKLLEVYRDPSLANYAVVSAVSDDPGDGSGGRLLLAGLAGQVTMLCLNADAGRLSKVLEATVAVGKIFAACLLSPTEFLVSESGRRLGLWATTADGRAAERLASGELPEMKQPWVTVARQWTGGCCVVGDRCGGVRFFSRVGKQLKACQSYHRIHGPHGVTDICCIRYRIIP